MMQEANSFTHATLPVIGKRVLRMGIAGNYGADLETLRVAAERGANFWIWTPNYKVTTAALREILPRERDKHVVSMLGVAWLPGGVKRGVEKALKTLGTDYLDCYQLSWLGTGSSFTGAVQDALLQVKQEGKVRSVGVSIHDRERAGRLARESILDLFMIRYNAAHPGAERDIFPHLGARNPAMVCYTATSWRQLLKPLGIDMPPWPGEGQVPPLTAALCYRFCLMRPEFHVVLTGPASTAQLLENLATLEAGPLPPEQEAWVRAYGEKVRARKKIPFL